VNSQQRHRSPRQTIDGPASRWLNRLTPRRWLLTLVVLSAVALALSPLLSAANVLAAARSDPTQPVPQAGLAQADPQTGLARAVPELSFAAGPCDDGDEAIAHAQSLRQATGLPSDAATLAASVTEPAYRCTAFGVSMTEEELRQFGDVLDAQGELSNIATEASSEPTFGGAYFDADKLKIFSTDGQLGQSYRTASGVIVSIIGKYTWKELQEVATELGNERQASKEYPFEIVRVSVNPRTNRVDVDVAMGAEAATKYFADAYGDKVNVQYEPRNEMTYLCSTFDCGTKGGAAAWHWTPDNGCTTGFLVQAHKGSGAWNHYMLTAGHCIDGTGGLSNPNPWQNWVGTVVWGTNKANEHYLYSCGSGGFSSCRNGDQGLFGLGGQTPSSWNRYVIGSSDVPIDGTTIDWNQFVGQVLWRNGLNSGLDSGAITDIPQEVSCGFWCYDYGLVVVDMVSGGGDSGAGFYRLYTSGGTTHRSAYGVLSGVPRGQTSPTYYSSYHSSLDSADGSSWHFIPCITATCPLN
jgi:hypothetical protein